MTDNLRALLILHAHLAREWATQMRALATELEHHACTLHPDIEPEEPEPEQEATLAAPEKYQSSRPAH
jgi:hypothetical protein